MDIQKRQIQIKRLTWLLENSFRLPGTNLRFGLEGLVGLVPVLGDAMGLLIGLFYVAAALEAKVSKTDLLKIIYWIALDGIVGMIPVLGDLFDFAFKAHLKIYKLLENKYWQKL